MFIRILILLLPLISSLEIIGRFVMPPNVKSRVSLLPSEGRLVKIQRKEPLLDRNHRHSYRPSANEFINTFVTDYKNNLGNLRRADPCVFKPCGANTYCIEDKKNYHRKCICNKGFIAHPWASESCVRPCLLQTCGHNAFCVEEVDGSHRCICRPNLYPINSLINKGEEECVDPCQRYPCNSKGTICHARSATTRNCICQPYHLPFLGDAEANGCYLDPCSDVGFCDTKTQYCSQQAGVAKCNCLAGYIMDKETSKCIKNPCSEEDACGQNTICHVGADQKRMCVCKPHFFTNVAETPEEHGCIDPCTDTSCSQPHTICIGISSTDTTCVCKDDKVPIHDNAHLNGCEDVCIDEDCGHNAKCVHNKCSCDPGFFNSEWKLKHIIERLYCVDPCEECNESHNTVCLAQSATEYLCYCKEDYNPIENDAEKNGCYEDPCRISITCDFSKEYCIELSPGVPLCSCKPENINSSTEECDDSVI